MGVRGYVVWYQLKTDVPIPPKKEILDLAVLRVPVHVAREKPLRIFQPFRFSSVTG
jgi:hypothetical protein